VSTLRRAVLGKKHNSCGNLKILLGISQKPLGIFRETQSNEVKFFRKGEFFGGISPKILG